MKEAQKVGVYRLQISWLIGDFVKMSDLPILFAFIPAIIQLKPNGPQKRKEKENNQCYSGGQMQQQYCAAKKCVQGKHCRLLERGKIERESCC